MKTEKKLGGWSMAHRLVPMEGQAPLSTDDVLVRFCRAFGYVDASRDLGALYMDSVIAELRQVADTHPQAVDLDQALSDRDYAIRVACYDKVEDDLTFFATTIIRGQMLIEYASKEHEEAAGPLIDRAAQALGYRRILL